MDPKYISDELFHFFGRPTPTDHERNYQVLKAVLASGCISHPPHEVGHGKVSYQLDMDRRLAREEMLVPTVTCYCDIPYELLAPHIGKYGAFGLSFSRHALTKAGARPVVYVPCRPDDWRGVFTGHTLLDELESTFRAVREQKDALAGSGVEVPRSISLGGTVQTPIEALVKAEHTLALRLLAFVKPYESTLDQSDPRYYYSEREWRKLGNFLFSPQDVQRIVVHASFLERATQELPEFAEFISPAPT